MNKITNLHGFNINKVKAIEGDDKVRAQKYGQAITAILEQYDCIIVPELHMIGSQMSHGIKIVPKPRQLKG